MIAEVLDKDFVLKQLEIVHEFLRSGGRRGSDIEPPPVEVTEDDLQTAATEINKSLASEAARSSGPRGSDRERWDRRGDPSQSPPSLENRAFISSDPVFSIRRAHWSNTSPTRMPPPPTNRVQAAEAMAVTKPIR